MSDTVLAALVGVGGAVLVAIVSVIVQLFTTRSVINSEKEKTIIQINLAEKSRVREKRIDRIINAVSELLITSDPQSNDGVNYGRTTNLIIQTQLLLDISVQNDRILNEALNTLGEYLQEYYVVKDKYIDNKISETKLLLEAHSDVIEKTRIWLKDYGKSSLVKVDKN